jgi:GAF domain-containing protein
MSNLLSTATLSQLVRVRSAGVPLDEVLQQLVSIAKAELEPADEVSITLVDDDRPFTAAYTGQLALDADELQYERGYGPCIDAGTTGTALLVPDMRVETRWPDYAQRVVERGVLSSLSVALPLQTTLVGALNTYSRTVRGFDEGAVEPAVELAGHVAVAVANAWEYTNAAESADQMRQAMASRAVIEQAKGIIMAQNHCDAAAAFEILRLASQNRNVKLRDVAASVVEGVAVRAANATDRSRR